MKTIPLTRGYEAIVDDDLHEQLSIFNWHAVVSEMDGRIYIYGARWSRFKGRRRVISLHHQVLGFSNWELDGTGSLIDHKNRNTLDNRKDNLRVTNKSVNAINSDRAEFAKGVYFDRSRNRWKAFILHSYQRRKYIGTFKTEKEAIEAREKVLQCE